MSIVTRLPAIDVVIPAYNAERTLERAVTSVWATGYPDLHLYVVDDGSSDSTHSVALELKDQSRGRCEVLRHPGGQHRGVSASRNLAILAGSSEWVAFLDADDEYLPNRFTEFAARVAREGETFDALHESVRVVCDEDAVDSAPFEDGELFGLNRGEESTDGSSGALESLLEGRTWPTTAITIRRTLVSHTGLFDERRAIAEDCHLWMRVACLGRVTGSSSRGPVALYRRHGANSYHFGSASRLALLNAMSDVAKWARSNSLPPYIGSKLAVGVSKYAFRTCVWARENGDRPCAWNAIRQGVPASPYTFLVSLNGWKQIAALVLHLDHPAWNRGVA